jgi:hypothetical protein
VNICSTLLFTFNSIRLPTRINYAKHNIKSNIRTEHWPSKLNLSNFGFYLHKHLPNLCCMWVCNCVVHVCYNFEESNLQGPEPSSTQRICCSSMGVSYRCDFYICRLYINICKCCRYVVSECCTYVAVQCYSCHKKERATCAIIGNKCLREYGRLYLRRSMSLLQFNADCFVVSCMRFK